MCANPGHLLFVNVLVVALLTTSEAIPESVPDDVAVNSLNAASTPNLIKRYLKFHADTTTSDHAIDFEERGVASSLSKYIEDFKVKQWQSENKTPEQVLAGFSFNEHRDELLEELSLLKWTEFYRSRYTGKKEKLVSSMQLLLLKRYNTNKKLATFLMEARKTKGLENIAYELIDFQLKVWKRRNIDPRDVYLKLLKLQYTDDDLLLLRWCLSANEFHLQDNNVLAYLIPTAPSNEEMLAARLDSLKKKVKGDYESYFENTKIYQYLEKLQGIVFQRMKDNGVTPDLFSGYYPYLERHHNQDKDAFDQLAEEYNVFYTNSKNEASTSTRRV